MHLQVNTVQIHEFEDGLTVHTVAFWILCECGTYNIFINF